MAQFLQVCAAGALGTGCRYLIGLLGVRLFGGDFPYGTLTVNIVGCFLMAFVMHIGLQAQMISPGARITIATGFIGGLTTYSSFNFETTRFIQERAWASGLLYFVLTVGICFMSGLAGLAVARRFVASS